LLNRRVWPGFWINFGMGGGLFSFAGLWGIPLLRDVFGLERGAAAAYTTLTLAGLALGSLASGWLSDYLGYRKPVLIAGAVFYALAWVAMLYAPWSPGISGFVLFGLIGLTGAGFVVTYACAKEVCAPALSGMAISVVNTGLFLGAALMQPLFGWVLDQTWDGTLVNGLRQFALDDYRAALWLMFGFAVVALIGALRLTETYCHNVTVKD